jgi:hypothetical protein
MMARSPRDEFGTPFGQAGSAAAAKLGTPFGQAGSAAAPKTKLQQFQEEKAQRDADIAVAKKAQEDATAAAFANKPADEPGFTWRFVTLAGGGGEWRKYKSSTGLTGGDGDPGKGSGNAAEDLLLKQQRDAEEAAKLRDRQSAYDILYNEFNRYGLGSLVEDVKYLLQSNVSPSQFALELQNTKAYQQRFSANQNRIKAGLSALSPAEYIGLEDQYQNIMRNYGLPASYYTKDSTGKQSGFDKFLEGDVSAAELEDRVVTAQQRVINSNPQVLTALKQFYPDITNGDILAYTLDPKNALTNIKQKVTAAEIQGAADVFGLNRITAESTPAQIKALEARAQALAGYGVDKAAATEGFAQVAEIAPRGSQLADIYKEAPYTQETAESEVFRTSGAAEAKAKRKKLTALEQASFSGSSGVGQGAIGRDRGLGQGQF